jgi:hypothetical protein
MKPEKRPGNSSATTTPRSAEMLSLVGGGMRHGGVAVTSDEYLRLCRLYGIFQEDRTTSAGRFAQAGADVSVFRAAELDGLRIVAWLAKHIEPGQDPLKTIVQMAIEYGLDVDPADVDWIEECPASE